MKEAPRNIESIAALEDICGEINNMVLKQDALIALNIAYISESIYRAGKYPGLLFSLHRIQENTQTAWITAT